MKILFKNGNGIQETNAEPKWF